MKIKLNVKDRLAIISILPTKGNIMDLVEVMDIVKIIKFDNNEKQSINFKDDNGRFTWDESKQIDKDFEFTIDLILIIKKAIQEMDSKNAIDISILNTCLKFIKL